MKRFALALLACLPLVLPALTARADDGGDAILGTWHTTDDKSQVKIFQRNHKYFAEISGITKPNWPHDDKFGMGGKPRTDRKNPDPKLRDRPLLGIEIMSDFVYEGKNLWDDGKIYDPESGKTYKCKMTLLPGNRLEVRGYIGFSLIGRTVVWTR
jgi:uncharacterized protein (DUF2147 family)